MPEYLHGEEESPIRHEYIAGLVYAMAGGSDRHNLIVGNLHAALRPVARAKRCQLFFSDVKLRLRMAGEEIFYYPDLMVVCDPHDREPLYREFPTIVIEVLSEATERIDRHEKFRNYTQLQSLQEYVLIAQAQMEVTVFRRANSWQPQVLTQSEQSLV